MLGVVALVLLLVSCSPSDTGVQSWRDLEVTVPEGWSVFERRDDLLSMANAPLGDEAGDPGDRVVAVQFTHQPSARPDAWRELVTTSGGTIESDRAIELDGVPATQLVFRWVTNDVPTREMVVVVPARELVMLFQPVPVAGQTDAPKVFLRWADQFEAILDSIRFGAPAQP